MNTEEIRKIRYFGYYNLRTSLCIYIPIREFDLSNKNYQALVDLKNGIILNSNAELEQKKYDFIHEILHVLLNHIRRGSSSDITNQLLWSIASDHVVNSMMVNLFNFSRKKLKEYGYLFLDSSFPYGPTEVVYRKLCSMYNNHKSKFSNLYSKIDVLSDFIKNTVMKIDENVKIEEIFSNNSLTIFKIGDKIIRVFKDNNYDYDLNIDVSRNEFLNYIESIGKLEKYIVREFNIKYSRREIFKLIESEVNAIIGYKSNSFTYTSIPYYGIPLKRKNNIRLPDCYRKNLEFAFAIDSSGSITDEDIGLFMGVLKRLSSKVNKFYGWVIDYKIHNFYMNPDIPFEVKGGGGTDFTPVFKEIEERGLKPKVLLFFTDLLGIFPNKVPSFKTIWIVPEDKMIRNIPFGKVFLI